MDHPEQLSLFTETNTYTIETMWEGQMRTWDLPDVVDMDQARTALRNIAHHLSTNWVPSDPWRIVDFDNHITPDGRMYGMRGNERVVLEIVAHPTYSYPQE